MNRDVEHYQRFIDTLVDLAKKSVLTQRIRSHGHPVRIADPEGLPLSHDETALKELFTGLTPAQRDVIVSLIHQTRRSAIHDVATLLEDQIATGDMTLAIAGTELGESPYASYAYDFTCRVEGDPWPAEES